MFNRLQMVQFECARVRNPCFSFTFGEFPFPIFSLSSSFWGIKKLLLMVAG